MFDVTYSFFHDSGLFSAHSVFYFLLFGLIVGLFVVCLVRAFTDRETHKVSKDESDLEKTTEIVSITPEQHPN